jgi:hypothetical protein
MHICIRDDSTFHSMLKNETSGGLVPKTFWQAPTCRSGDYQSPQERAHGD